MDNPIVGRAAITTHHLFSVRFWALTPTSAETEVRNFSLSGSFVTPPDPTSPAKSCGTSRWSLSLPLAQAFPHGDFRPGLHFDYR